MKKLFVSVLALIVILPAAVNAAYVTTQVTNNGYPDHHVKINSTGQIVWMGSPGSTPEHGKPWNVYMFDGNSTTELNSETAYSSAHPDINDNGQAVWVEYDFASNDHEVIFWDGSSRIQLTNNDYRDISPRINSSGQIVWLGWDGNDWEVFLYDGSSVIQISDNSFDDLNPEISDSGAVTWVARTGFGVYEVFYAEDVP